MASGYKTASVKVRGEGIVGRDKDPLYDQIIQDFLDSKEKSRVIYGGALDNRTPGTIQVMLNTRLKDLEKQHLVIVRKLPPSKIESGLPAALKDKKFVVVLELRTEKNPYKPQPRKDKDEDKSAE